MSQPAPTSCLLTCRAVGAREAAQEFVDGFAGRLAAFVRHEQPREIVVPCGPLTAQ